MIPDAMYVHVFAMYGTFTYIWVMFGACVGKYSIHDFDGINVFGGAQQVGIAKLGKTVVCITFYNYRFYDKHLHNYIKIIRDIIVI